MKTKNLFMTAALLGALSAGAGSNAFAQTADTKAEEAAPYVSSLYIQETKPMQFRVSFKNPLENKLTVRIVDTDNNVLYSDYTSTSANYLKYFDLSPLSDGRYTFEITDGKEKHIQSFDIMTQTRRIVTAKN
ncbi:DUF3244 domain-containing protein [Telluribacter humicola]|uniref:DUF3244 domain-containing protein n=1 Tax=Telluribacter humicola TaxID=1720261 RepID=UPI001A9583D9|nr:DUF3244 domain-containing protein [Telluribacter humicola]